MSVLKILSKRWEFVLGLLVVTWCVLVAVAAPFLAPPSNPEAPAEFQNVGTRQEKLARRPLPPSAKAVLGTTPDQNDIFYTLVWGTRSALRFGLIVSLGAAALGTFLGTLSAYLGGWMNGLILRVTDGFITFPLIAGVIVSNQLSLIVLQNIFGENYITATFSASPPAIPLWFQIFFSLELIFILFTWMPYARLTNAMITRVKSTDFVEAAHSLGAGHARIIFRHLMPNAVSPVIVLLSKDIGGVVVLQSALTFIGISGGSAWGSLLVMGRDWIIGPGGDPLGAWWVFVPASLAIILFSIGWSLLGDGLNDLLNPRRSLL